MRKVVVDSTPLGLYAWQALRIIQYRYWKKDMEDSRIGLSGNG
jgi:hypothetical protein